MNITDFILFYFGGGRWYLFKVTLLLIVVHGKLVAFVNKI